MHLPKSIVNQIMQDIQQELEEEENKFQQGMEDEEEESVEMMEYLASIEDYANEVVPTPVPSPVPEGECWIPDPDDHAKIHQRLSGGQKLPWLGSERRSVLYAYWFVDMYRDWNSILVSNFTAGRFCAEPLLS